MNHLKRAFKKSIRHDGDIMCGYLIPLEILALFNAGYGLDCQEQIIEEAKRAKETGETKSRWYYFRNRK